jgi:hypothetical protein
MTNGATHKFNILAVLESVGSGCRNGSSTGTQFGQLNFNFGGTAGSYQDTTDHETMYVPCLNPSVLQFGQNEGDCPTCYLTNASFRYGLFAIYPITLADTPFIDKSGSTTGTALGNYAASGPYSCAALYAKNGWTTGGTGVCYNGFYTGGTPYLLNSGSQVTSRNLCTVNTGADDSGTSPTNGCSANPRNNFVNNVNYYGDINGINPLPMGHFNMGQFSVQCGAGTHTDTNGVVEVMTDIGKEWNGTNNPACSAQNWILYTMNSYTPTAIPHLWNPGDNMPMGAGTYGAPHSLAAGPLIF